MDWRRRYGPETYDEFSEDFNSTFDPRTFWFRYRTKKEQQDYIDNMSAPDRRQFLVNLTHAHKRGWMKHGAE